MAFLTLGGTVYEVQTNGAHQAEMTYAGEATRSFNGSYRSGRRAPKRSWTFTLIPLSEVDELAFRAVVGTDTPLTASGDFSNNVAVSVVCNITGSDYLPSGSGFVRVVAVTLSEV